MSRSHALKVVAALLLTGLLWGCGRGAPESQRESTETKPAASPAGTGAVAAPGPATPEEAVERLTAAANSGDAKALAAVSAPPFDALILEGESLRGEILDAHEKLSVELNAAFGPPQHDSPQAFGNSFAEEVIASLRTHRRPNDKMHEVRAKVVEQKQESGQVQLTVEETFNIGGREETRTIRRTAVKQGDVWKFLPDINPESVEADLHALHTLRDAYHTAAKEVRDGLYKSRSEVTPVMIWALAMSQSWLAASQALPAGLEEVFPIRRTAESGPLPEPIRIRVANEREKPVFHIGPNKFGSDSAMLEAKLKELRKAHAGEEQPPIVIEVAGEDAGSSSFKSLFSALEALLDAGFDYRRVAFVMNEKQHSAMTEQLTGRLRLFAIGLPQDWMVHQSAADAQLESAIESAPGEDDTIESAADAARVDSPVNVEAEIALPVELSPEPLRTDVPGESASDLSSISGGALGSGQRDKVELFGLREPAEARDVVYLLSFSAAPAKAEATSIADALKRAVQALARRSAKSRFNIVGAGPGQTAMLAEAMLPAGRGWQPRTEQMVRDALAGPPRRNPVVEQVDLERALRLQPESLVILTDRDYELEAIQPWLERSKLPRINVLAFGRAEANDKEVQDQFPHLAKLAAHSGGQIRGVSPRNAAP